MSVFKPSRQQEIALKKLNVFLASPGGGVFILKGYAGTGKTTLLQKVALDLSREKKKFVLLAPTGRAATVLKAKTGLEAKTIHSELYSFSDIDGEVSDEIVDPSVDQFGQMRLLFSIRTPDPLESKLFIVDEASMISDDPGDTTSYAHFGSGHLLSDLLHIIGTNKVIFSGDPSQLPPYGSSESPALSISWMKRQGKVVDDFEMTEILRQKQGSGILQLATKVRRMTEEKTFPKWIKLPASNHVQVDLLSYESQKQLYITHILKNRNTDSIAICNSNYNCYDINKSVRSALYSYADAPLQVGDILMITQNNHLVPLINGDFVEVLYIGAKQKYLGISFIHVTVKSQLSTQEFETLLCEEVLYNGQSNLNLDQQRMLMIDFSKRMRMKGIKPKSEQYYNALQKDTYLNSLRANFGYAVTCQKSQGGEWANVFLFLNKGMYNMSPESLTRWWYTGITRAKEKLYLVNDWWIT
jgi:ATP-dependent exoDNAse (exonuclease V) alpha subunit